MAHSWDEMKQLAERVENARLERWLEESETREEQSQGGLYLVRRVRPVLELLGGLAVGLHVAVFAMIFNYLLFVWILHVNFDF